MRWALLIATLALAACVQPVKGPAPGADAYTRPAPRLATDANVYVFEQDGPNSLGTTAVTVRPTAGPDAAPAGTISGIEGRARAEAAAAYYAENTLCEGTPFRLAAEATSRYDPATNAWTVFGRCGAV